MIEQSEVVEAQGLRYRNMAAIVTIAVGQMVCHPLDVAKTNICLFFSAYCFFSFNSLSWYLSFRVLNSNSFGIMLVIFMIKIDVPALLNFFFFDQ